MPFPHKNTCMCILTQGLKPLTYQSFLFQSQTMGRQGTCSWLLIPLSPNPPCLIQGPNWSECQHDDYSPGIPTSLLSSYFVWKLSHITLGSSEPMSFVLPKPPPVMGLHPERASLLNNHHPRGTMPCLAQATPQHFQAEIRPSIWGSS